MGQVKIILQSISKSFFQNEKLIIFEDFNLQIFENEFLAIIGPSGCGKTTLINIIAGFLNIDSGKIEMDSRIIDKPGKDRSVIFQDDAVFPWLTVKKNIEYGLKIEGLNKNEIDNRVEDYLDIFGLIDVKNQYPKNISGGERKRVDLARALITNPEVILMDEPFSHLDVKTKNNLQDFTLKFFREKRNTFIFSTHDVEEALFLSDRIISLSDKPAQILDVTNVPFKRPRDSRIKYTNEFQDLRRTITENCNL